MSGGLLVGGDPPPHVHDLPPIPTAPYYRLVEERVAKEWALENAVARCASCGRLFVSREDPDGWGRTVTWRRLRWWHRRARRALAARRRG